MKKQIALLFSLTVLFSIGIAAQVKITSEKVIYERKDKDIPEWKRKFEVNYPRFQIEDKEVQRQLEQTFGHWRVFETSLKDEQDYNWLESLDFKVEYNKHGIVVLKFMRSGTGAYPSAEFRTIVAELSSGKRVRLTDIFKNRIGLLGELDKRQSIEMKAAKKEFKKEGREGPLFDEYVQKASDQVEHFSVNDKGITFLFDYGFPNVMKAAEPDGEYFFSWNELKPFLSEYSSISDLIEKVSVKKK